MARTATPTTSWRRGSTRPSLHLLRRLAQEDRATRRLGAASVGIVRPGVRRAADDRGAGRGRGRHAADDDTSGRGDGRRRPGRAAPRTRPTGASSGSRRDPGRALAPPGRPGPPGRHAGGDARPLTPKERRRLDAAAASIIEGMLEAEVVNEAASRYSGSAPRMREGAGMRLQDKVTIITGGGGGMGRVAAQMFAAQGARVVVAEYGEAAGIETVELVRAGRRRGDLRAGRRLAGGRRQGDGRSRRRDLRPARLPVQQRRGHARGRPLGDRHRRRDLGCRHGGQRPRRLPRLQVRHPGDDRGRRRVDHQHRELRRDPRLQRAAGRLHRLEGRGPVADPQPGRPVRAARDPDQRDLPRPGRDAAADGLAGQGRGGQAAPAGPQPDRPVRQARGDRPHGVYLASDESRWTNGASLVVDGGITVNYF